MKRFLQIQRNFSVKALCEKQNIRVPIGNLHCQWYGPKDVRPVVVFKGNSPISLRNLAPLISKDVGFLEVSLPKEKLPMRTNFHFSDDIQINLQLMSHFKWDKISLLGHSYAAFAAFNFASFFPDKVDLLITLDLISTAASPDQIVQNLSRRIEKIANMAAEKDTEAYDIEYCIEALYKVSEETIDKTFCNFIMERKLRPSTNHPGKCCFVDEKTLELYFNDLISREVIMEMAKRLECPYLAISYKDKKWANNMQKLVFDKAYEFLKLKSSTFEYHQLKGYQYSHVDSPEKVSGIINAFLEKHRRDKPQQAVECDT